MVSLIPACCQEDNTWFHFICCYTEDGKYEIDNNLVENSIRPVALGRKNYLFAGSHEGAERAAMIVLLFGHLQTKQC
ncbi:transposase [candidate division KSB1 bacterium]|nr:transposase [candidate division KSB1 bacterium]